MEQPHQHGPQCRHGHGNQGQGHGHGGHNHQGASEISSKQYFQKLNEMKQKNREFYWMQILSGNYFNKYCQQKGFDMVRSLNCQVIIMLVAQAQMMFACEWLPLFIRPFASGLFFPLVFLLFFNINVIFGVSSPDFTILHLFSYLAIGFYALTALRQPGALLSRQNAKKTQQAINQRGYLQNPNSKCPQCKILKVFRSFHCPMCQICVSKFTRHSLAFGSCIGSSNQLLAWGFFICLTLTQLTSIFQFYELTSYGIITNIMFYAVNIYILWISFVESATMWIMNFSFGLTEHQVKIWMMSQYLMKVPDRQFTNSVGKGLVNNLTQSFYALFQISGYESQKRQLHQNPMQQQMPISGNNEFQKLDSNKTYLVNWSKAYFYLVPQIPSHPCRDRVIQIMKRDQPRMIEMFKIQKGFRQQVLKQSSGQQLNQFQIQQKVAMKMQQHMMKNAQHMMPQMAPPSVEQQKTMQIQMITHMVGLLQQKQPQITEKLKVLIQNLKQNKMNPTQVGMNIRQIQQQLMKKQMQTVMRQRQEAEKAKASQNQDQQQQLKKQQIADQDL